MADEICACATSRNTIQTNDPWHYFCSTYFTTTTLFRICHLSCVRICFNCWSLFLIKKKKIAFYRFCTWLPQCRRKPFFWPRVLIKNVFVTLCVLLRHLFFLVITEPQVMNKSVLHQHVLEVGTQK